MKPISFAFGAGTKIEAPHGGKIRTKSKVEDIETKSTKSQGNAKTQNREKLKTNEPNAPLQMPDFSNEAKPKPVSADPHTKGDRSVQRGPNAPTKSVDAAVVQTQVVAPQSAEEFALQVKLKLNAKAAAAPEPFSGSHLMAIDPASVGAIDPDLAVANTESFICMMPIRSDISATGEIKLESNPLASEFPSQDLVDPKLVQQFLAANSQEFVDPKLASAYTASISQDFVDPKLVQLYLQSISQDWVQTSPIKVAHLNGAETVDAKSDAHFKLDSDLAAGQYTVEVPTQDFVDPKTVLAYLNSISQDWVDPKLVANATSAAPTQDLVDPKSAQAYLSSISQDFVDPKLASQFNSLIDADLTADPMLGLQVTNGLAQGNMDPKHAPAASQTPTPALIDPNVTPIKIATDSTGALHAPIKNLIANGSEVDFVEFPAQDFVDLASVKSTAPSVRHSVETLTDEASAKSMQPISFAGNVANAMAVVTSSTFTGTVLESANALIDDLATDEFDVKSEMQESTPVTGVDHATSRTHKADVKAVDARPLTRSEVSNVLEQIADRLESLAASKPRNGVTIHLKPFDLGSITMMIKGSGKSIEAEIQVSHESVRHALEQTQKHLSANLEARGYSLANITISDSAATNPQSTYSDAQSQLANQNGQSASGSRSNTNFATPNGAVATTQRNAFTAKADGVDYWI